MTIFDEVGNCQRITQLRGMGVEVWGPERVYVGSDVPLQSIQPGSVLMNAVVLGDRVWIGSRSRIGTSGQVTIRNCQIGEGVEVGAGLCDGCTLLEGVKVRGFAELREGTLLEEQVELGHNVGLKNTVLTSAVVTGSLINFCDAFVTGGFSRSDHTEIGSGTIHFNFDPRGDKFGSVFGDASGVLMRSKRIFLGGNCGFVAPLHIGFGSVVAAGATIRSDIAPDTVSRGDAEARKSVTFDPAVYYDVRRKFVTTAKLVGAMHALRAWYKWVRVPFAASTQIILYKFADDRLASHIAHRARELSKVISKLESSLHFAPEGSACQANSFEVQHRSVVENRAKIVSLLTGSGNMNYQPPPEMFLQNYIRERQDLNHIDAVRKLTSESADEAAAWLSTIAAQVAFGVEQIFSEG
jgi:acetyltransferase-like isoleucine patch superfamily enzyme